MTDAGGYFFIPIMPDGEDFTALAFDTGSVRCVASKGSGPLSASRVYMFFDFTATTNAIPTFPPRQQRFRRLALDETDLYVFVGTAGQLITVGAQGEPDFVSNYDVNLFSPTSANPLFSIGNGRFYTESSVVHCRTPASTPCQWSATSAVAAVPGPIPSASPRSNSPRPSTSASRPKTVEGEQTIYGDRHFFSFDAQAGDILKFSLSPPPRLRSSTPS